MNSSHLAHAFSLDYCRIEDHSQSVIVSPIASTVSSQGDHLHPEDQTALDSVPHLVTVSLRKYVFHGSRRYRGL